MYCVCAAGHPKSVVYTGYCTVSARIIFHNPRCAARLGDLKNNPLGTVQYPVNYKVRCSASAFLFPDCREACRNELGVKYVNTKILKHGWFDRN